MEVYSHIRIVIGIILGLSITHLLKGTAKFIQHPNRDKPYWIHLLWVLYLFLMLVHFWWWEFRFAHRDHWTFTVYFFMVTYVTTFFGLCALLYPDDIKDYKGYEDYFASRKKWFFAVLAFSFFIDIGDTALKGISYLQSFHWEYPVRIITHIALCLAAIRVNNKTFQGTIVILFILYELSFILRLFNII